MDFFSTCGITPTQLSNSFVQPSEEMLGYIEASAVVDAFEQEVVTRAALHALLVRNRLRPTESAVFVLGHGDCCGTRELVLAVPLCTNLVLDLCGTPPAAPDHSDGQVFLVLDGFADSCQKPASCPRTDSIAGKAPTRDRLSAEAFSQRIQDMQRSANSHRYFFPSKETNHDWIYSYGADRLPMAVQKASSPMWQRRKPEKMASLIFQDTHLRMLVEPQIPWRNIHPFLKERQTEFSQEARRGILTVTFNCAAQMPAAHEVEHLFEKMEERPDVIFVALQETCPLALAIDVTEISSAQYHEAWTTSVTAAVQRQGAYRFLADRAMVGLLLLLYVRDDLVPQVSQTCWGTTRCGTLGAGNKGAVAFGLVLRSTSLCFVNAHLAAGERASSAQERSQDFDYIVQTLRLAGAVGPADVRDSRNLFEHDLVIWAGDLNMRLWRDTQMTEVMHRKEVLSMLGQDKVTSLLELDELHRRRLASGPIAAFEEAKIGFHPSYKFRTCLPAHRTDSGAKDAAVPHEAQYDEKRSPAWCDRIMWRARRKVKQEGQPRYERLDSPAFSDHRPVRLSLQICVNEMSWDDLKRVFAEYELKRMASRSRFLRSGSSLEEAAGQQTEASLTSTAL